MLHYNACIAMMNRPDFIPFAVCQDLGLDLSTDDQLLLILLLTEKCFVELFFFKPQYTCACCINNRLFGGFSSWLLAKVQT